MSRKGELVVPKRMRERKGFRRGDVFAAIEVEDGVLFKRVHVSKLKTESESLSRDIQHHLEKRKT